MTDTRKFYSRETAFDFVRELDQGEYQYTLHDEDENGKESWVVYYENEK